MAEWQRLLTHCGWQLAISGLVLQRLWMSAMFSYWKARGMFLIPQTWGGQGSHSQDFTLKRSESLIEWTTGNQEGCRCDTHPDLGTRRTQNPGRGRKEEETGADGREGEVEQGFWGRKWKNRTNNKQTNKQQLLAQWQIGVTIFNLNANKVETSWSLDSLNSYPNLHGKV